MLPGACVKLRAISKTHGLGTLSSLCNVTPSSCFAEPNLGDDGPNDQALCLGRPASLPTKAPRIKTFHELRQRHIAQ
jgi:hypothetical protein